jgi:lipid-A-disaccharide synthase-like uncharacterized protein
MEKLIMIVRQKKFALLTLDRKFKSMIKKNVNINSLYCRAKNFIKYKLKMKLFVVRNQNEYLNLKNSIGEHIKALTQLIPSKEQSFELQGYSFEAVSDVKFLVDFQYSTFPNVNWRERVICPITGFNNRTRYSLMILEMYVGISRNDKVYIMEQVTGLFSHLKNKYPNLIGSEYINDSLNSGDKNSSGILHQDATKLSFSNDSFKIILSFDVFEHVPNFKKAFEESLRVLKNGGRLIFTVPFVPGENKTLIRARIQPNGDIEHLCEPEYHGDPMASNDGILCFQHFGWDLIGLLKDIGFKHAYAIIGYSIDLGFPSPQIIFIAEK